MVDAEAVAARRVPGEFADLGIAAAPQIAKPDRLDRVHVMGADIDRAGLVDIGAAGVEIADRERLGLQRFGGERGDQRLPIRHFLHQIRHVDAVDPQRAEIRPHHAAGIRHRFGDRSAIVEGLPRRDQDAVAASGRGRCGRMRIADRSQRGAQPLAGLAAAVFGDDQHIGLVLRQRGGNRRQPRAAALADVPGEDPQCHAWDINRRRRAARRGR